LERIGIRKINFTSYAPTEKALGSRLSLKETTALRQGRHIFKLEVSSQSWGLPHPRQVKISS
jgi:hypothetical protein